MTLHAFFVFYLTSSFLYPPRLAEIDAKILALGGALSIVDSNIKDDSAHGKNCDPTTVSANLLRHGKSNHSDNEAKHNTNEAAADQPPPLSPSRSARNTTAKCITPKGAIVPGEGTLREQRESRQIRDRERAIDIALEQVCQGAMTQYCRAFPEYYCRILLRAAADKLRVFYGA